MVRVSGEIVIHRPVEEVFDCVADERNEPLYNPQMHRVEKISDGSIGVGTCFHGEVLSGGKPAEMTIEFTAFDRPRRLGSRTRMAAMDIEGGLTFDPVPEGTRMRWLWEVQPHGFLRWMGPLVAFIGRRNEMACWTGLKRYLETQSAPVRPPMP